MQTKTKFLIVIAGIAVIGLIFYGLRGKPKATGQTSIALEFDGPHLAWKFAHERTIFANLTLGPDGTIYASSNQGIFAISPDGQMKWHAQYGSISYTTMGNDGMLYAAEMHGFIFGVSPDGTVSWKPGYGLIGFQTPPAIGRAGMILFANTQADVFAFEQGSTTSAWSQNTFPSGAGGGENYSFRGAGAASPVVFSDDSIVLPRQHWLQLFSADGSSLWSIEVTPSTLGPAAIGEDGTVYVGDGRFLYAVDRSGSLAWKYEPMDGCCIGSPVVDADGIIYFTTARSVCAVDRLGTLKWQVNPKHAPNSSPALAADGSIYFTGSDGLSALNADGSEKWSVQAPRADSPPSIAADGTAYFVCGMIWVCAVEGTHSPLMKSPWPKIYHDSGNTGNVLTTY